MTIDGRKLACFTLDLEPDWGEQGAPPSHRVFEDDEAMEQFSAFMSRNDIPLSIYVLGKMLDEGMQVRDRFAGTRTEFELHSYSHDPANPDSEEEICRGKEAFLRHMGRSPIGYRAPLGDISPAGIAILQREGFLYDASVFPTNRPELGYNHLDAPTEPYLHDGSPPMVELPFAVVPKIRLVISMSFLKLFGMGAYRAMFRIFGMPDVLVFDSHLYDFFPALGVRLRMTNWRRYALMRNGRRTFDLLQSFVDHLRGQGYELIFMSELYQMASSQLGVEPSSFSADANATNGKPTG